MRGPEWSTTHQCTNVDGWCTDRILFSIPVPPHVDFFCLPFLSPDQPWSALISVFICNFFFSPHCTGFLFFFFFWNFSHPPTYYPPLAPTHLLTYIFELRVDSSPIYLVTYKFKMCYSHPHPSTHPTTNLPTNTLSRYLPNPTYITTPIYMVATTIDPKQSTTMRKE